MRKVTLGLLGIFPLIILVALGTYHYTKEAYYIVGRNDGLIEASADTLKRLTEIVKIIPICTEEQLNEGSEVVTVKAESIYAIHKDSAAVALCMAS